MATSVVPSATVVGITADYSRGSELHALLKKAGIAGSEAIAAARLVHSAGPIAKPTRMTIYLGDRLSEGNRRLEPVRLRPTFEKILTDSVTAAAVVGRCWTIAMTEALHLPPRSD